MALPIISIPTYEVILPLSKKKIEFRPFVVKEQKILLIAMESGDTNDIQKSVKQLLRNCTLSKGIDIEKLPMLDIEFYFLNLRARSVGEIVDAAYKCENVVDDKVCGSPLKISWNLLDIKADMSKLPNNVIQITPEISMKFNYPDFSLADKLKSENQSSMVIEVVVHSIDYIYDGKNYYYSKESTKEELEQFVENLSLDQFKKIEDFFTNIPTLKKSADVVCKKCGFHHTISVEGIESFFA